MPLYRLSSEYFLNDFIRTCFYGHNQPQGENFGLTPKDIFDSIRKDKQSYVITTQALTVDITS